MTAPKPLGPEALTCLTDPLAPSGLRTLFRQRRAWRNFKLKGGLQPLPPLTSDPSVGEVVMSQAARTFSVSLSCARNFASKRLGRVAHSSRKANIGGRNSSYNGLHYSNTF